MQHFILTRFNLQLWPTDKRGRDIQRETDWLEERFRLFETFCLPSLRAQTCMDFDWVLLMDAETPQPWRERMEHWKAQMPQLHPVWVPRPLHRQFPAVFQRLVSKHLHEGGQRVLTTYLDNDDALHRRFVEEVQRRAPGLQGGTFLFFPHGLQYFTSLQLATRIAYPNNHFCTLVEDYARPAQVRTVYGYGSHFLLHRNPHIPIHLATDAPPLWIEVVHERNVDNDVKMTLRTALIPSSRHLAEDFDLHLPYAKHPRLRFLSRFLLRAMREMVRRARGKIICL